MPKRPRPRQHLGGTLAWSLAAAAGLWPAVPGMGLVGAEPIAFLELVRYSDGVLGVVAVAGLVGLVAAVLHLLTALDLWIDERALRRGGTSGNWRAVRLAVPTALALAVLMGGSGYGFYNLRKDQDGRYAAIFDGFAVRAGVAWPRLEGLFARSSPRDATVLPAPGADPVPALRAIQRTPVAAEAYHVARDGWLTLLDEAGRVHRFHLPTWRPPQAPPSWPAIGPRPRGPRPGVEPMAWLVERIGEAHLGFGPHQPWEMRTGFHPLRVRTADDAFYAKGDARRGYLGYRLDDAFLDAAGALLVEAGLPGRWAVRGDFAEDAVPRPEVETGRLGPIVLDLHLSERSGAAHFEGTLTALAGLAVLFFAAMIEAVRQFRALIAERAMSMAQSSFVSGVSHEMRTPLATVRLYAELLEQRLDREAGQREEFVRAILLEVDRLHRLIENVLDFARISGRKRVYGFVPTDLRAVAEEAVAATRGPLAAAGLAVEIHAPAPLSAAIDRDAVVQALTNLLTNAAKYAPEGQRVWVSVLPGPLGVAIAVQDFGPGIAKEDRAKIFRPFYRVPGTAAGGSGLGLALVLEYARAHGGHVELESAPGQGATFRLHLPLDPTTAAAPRREAPWDRAIAALRRRTAA